MYTCIHARFLIFNPIETNKLYINIQKSSQFKANSKDMLQ